MARGKYHSNLLGVSVLALLGAAGCGQVNVTENAAPASSSPGNGGLSTTPTQPSTPSAPSTGTPSNPGSLNPPTQAVGDPATATANSAVLTTTRTTIYNLNPNAVGQGSWQNATLIEDINNQGPAQNTQVALDSAGNGFAIYTYRNGFAYVSRYTASTASWSAPFRLDSGTPVAVEPRIAVDRQSGNAIATWVKSDGTAASQYVRQYNAATSTWGAAQLLETTNNAVVTSEATAVSINGSQAAIVWRQSDGTVVNVYLSRLVSGAWTAPVVVDTSANAAGRAEVATDTNGNVMIVWRQLEDEQRIHARRWNNSTQTFGSVTLLDGDGDRQPRLGMDAAGNAFALWRGGGVYVRRYDVAMGSWSPQLRLDNQVGTPIGAELSVDTAGNAMSIWTEENGTDKSVYVARYDAASAVWGAEESMETSNVPVNNDKNPTVSISGNNAVVAWAQRDPAASTRDNIYGRERADGVWGPVRLLETSDNNADFTSSSITVAGNGVVVWAQADAYAAHYLSSNFVVPNGATWQSLANTLYGVNSVQGGNALQAALGNITLTPGAVLTGLPATLSVTTTIPGYYTVLATDTWSHIARTVYGITDVNAISQLRTLLGNPTLSAGLQLVVPTSYNYVTSGSYSAPLNWALVNTTTTTYHTLNTSLLTTPLDSWSAQQQMESDFAEAFTPRITFDANSNGIAVWAQASDIMMSRYAANTATWSTPVALDSNTNEAHNPRLAMDRATGNAVVSWSQSDGTAESMYVSSFNAGTNAWSTATLLETNAGAVSLSTENSGAAKAGNYAAVTWQQEIGGQNNVYLSRLVGGTWTAPALIDTAADEAEQAGVAIDANGNATVIWRQMQADGERRIYVRRWDNTAQAYGAVTAINGDGDRQPHIAFDAAGNGFALWGPGAYVRRFNVTTGQWGPQVQLHVNDIANYNGDIAVDAAGNALAAWMEHDGTTLNTFARYFDVTTLSWGTPVSLENSANPASDDKNLSVSLVNGSGVVTWVQEDGEPNIYAARYANGTWGNATMLDTDPNRTGDVAAAIDGNNNATVLWIQADSVYRSVSNATPYYTVPAGATYRSIAATLYNVNSDAAGQALQTAMSNTPLSTGLHLQGLPLTLAVSPQVPTHYIVHSGDTWASITLALYGTNATQAAAALQTVLNNPALTAGTLLYVPSELSYSVPDA